MLDGSVSEDRSQSEQIAGEWVEDGGQRYFAGEDGNKYQEDGELYVPPVIPTPDTQVPQTRPQHFSPQMPVLDLTPEEKLYYTNDLGWDEQQLDGFVGLAKKFAFGALAQRDVARHHASSISSLAPNIYNEYGGAIERHAASAPPNLDPKFRANYALVAAIGEQALFSDDPLGELRRILALEEKESRKAKEQPAGATFTSPRVAAGPPRRRTLVERSADVTRRSIPGMSDTDYKEMIRWSKDNTRIKR